MNFSTRNVRLNLRKKYWFSISEKNKLFLFRAKKVFWFGRKNVNPPQLLKVKWYAPNEYIFIYCACAMLKNKNTLCKWTSLFEKPLFKLQNLECFRFCTHYSLICVLYLINRYGSVSDHLTFKGRVCSSSKTGFFFTRNKNKIFFLLKLHWSSPQRFHCILLSRCAIFEVFSLS
jgi:hypothetical protein